MSSAEPQPVLTPLTEAAIILVLTVPDGGEDAVRDLFPDISGLRRSVGFRVPETELTCVVGLGSGLWDRPFGSPRPAGLHPFREIRGSRHTAVATPGDMLVHIRAHRFDVCFELAQHITDRLAGGSYVVVQKYVHNLTAWNALPARNRSWRSVRLNMSFGRVGAGEFGTYFIGYTADTDVIEQMLTNMFVGSPPGNHDRIRDFSTAVTGCLFFAPSADFLDDPPVDAPADAGAVQRGSLGIGSLKGDSS
jgi:putative iron-dependent peroxidase